MAPVISEAGYCPPAYRRLRSSRPLRSSLSMIERLASSIWWIVHLSYAAT